MPHLVGFKGKYQPNPILHFVPIIHSSIDQLIHHAFGSSAFCTVLLHNPTLVSVWKFVIPSVILTFSQMKVIENLKESVPVHYESEPRMRKYGVYKQQLLTSEWYIIPIAISKVENATICYGATSSTPVAKQRYESLDGGRRGYTLWRATRMRWFPKNAMIKRRLWTAVK